MDAVAQALADPIRRDILRMLSRRTHTAGELDSAFSVSRPAVSRHLRVLREAGLVEVRAEAQRRVYRVRPEPLRAIDDWLAPYRARWPEALDALATHLDTMDDDEEST